MILVTYLMDYRSSLNSMLMISSSYCPQNDLDLDAAINRLYEWSCTWQLPIATTKCCVCTIDNCKHNLSDHLYGFNDFTFAYVDTVRYLGVTIDSRLKFDLHVDLIVHKAISRAYPVAYRKGGPGVHGPPPFG
jgi:hypothetical protein